RGKPTRAIKAGGRSSAVETTLEITLNGQRREVPAPLTVAQRLGHLKLKPEYVAVEVNRDLVSRSRHAEARVAPGDVLEIVTLVGGGAGASATSDVPPITVGTHTLGS